MFGLKRYIALTISSKTGISGGVIAGAGVALLCGLIAMISLLFASFIWLADRYTPLTAALIFADIFVVLTIGAVVYTVITRRSLLIKSDHALAQQSVISLVQPSHLQTAAKIANTIAWKRLAAVGGAALLVAGVAHEWGYSRPAR
jgi:endo-1,4-beta-D-glucanase Y